MGLIAPAGPRRRSASSSPPSLSLVFLLQLLLLFARALGLQFLLALDFGQLVEAGILCGGTCARGRAGGHRRRYRCWRFRFGWLWFRRMVWGRGLRFGRRFRLGRPALFGFPVGGIHGADDLLGLPHPFDRRWAGPSWGCIPWYVGGKLRYLGALWHEGLGLFGWRLRFLGALLCRGRRFQFQGAIRGTFLCPLASARATGAGGERPSGSSHTASAARTVFWICSIRSAASCFLSPARRFSDSASSFCRSAKLSFAALMSGSGRPGRC